MLRRVGIPNAAKRFNSYPHELSGGQRQRVMIAIALSTSPDLLIADKPTTALDVSIEAQILDLMRDLQDNANMAIMFITHNLGVIAEIADEVVVMYMGKEVERATTVELFNNPNILIPLPCSVLFLILAREKTSWRPSRVWFPVRSTCRPVVSSIRGVQLLCLVSVTGSFPIMRKLRRNTGRVVCYMMAAGQTRQKHRRSKNQAIAD